jgi:hypothetical protein
VSRLKEIRDALVADLDPLNVPVYGSWPIRADPPCVFLAPPLGGAYVAGGREIGTYVVSLDAVVLVERRPPDEGREDLEALLELLLRNSVDWALTGVDSPSAVTIAESTYEFLGTVVHLSKAFYL